MKLNKIFAIALAALTLSACSDDDDKATWNNNANVTVDMQKTEISVKENRGLFNVPVVVNGEADGNIMVTVQINETGSTPATDDSNFLVTSKTIVIEPEDKGGNIEIMTVDDAVINEPRTFTITIVEAKGAKIGNTPTTTVTLKDNDAAFYEKLQGAWKFNYATASGDMASYNVNILGYDEDEAGYDEVLYMYGFQGYSFMECEIDYSYDIATQKGSLFIPYGQLLSHGDVSFTGIGPADVYLATVRDGYVELDGGKSGVWSDDFNTITLENNGERFYLAVFGLDSDDFMGGWGSYYDPMTITR